LARQIPQGPSESVAEIAYFCDAFGQVGSSKGNLK
jgi:hypothetical protein